MKKLILIFSILCSVMLYACSSANVSKEELTQKIKDKTELTQEDYSSMIKYMSDDCDILAKWKKENPDAKGLKASDYPQEVQDAFENIMKFGFELDKAAEKDLLDQSNIRKYNKFMTKFQEVIKSDDQKN